MRALVVGGAIAFCTAAGFADDVKQAGAPGDVLFYCSFDGTITPEIQKGEKGSKSAAPAEFVKGIKGKALVTGHAKNAIYPVKGNIDVAEGTIKFWVMPMDWRIGDGLFHHFLTIPEQLPEADKNARVFSLLLYKFVDWDDVLAFGMAGKLTREFILRIPMTNSWAPQRWHQIAFTWDSHGAALYVDGKGAHRNYLQSGQSSRAPNVLAAQSFTVGGPYFIGNQSRTAIDELYIYKRKLTDQEIDQMYKTELIEGVMGR